MSPSSEVFVVPSQLSFIIYFWSIINLNYSWFDDHNVPRRACSGFDDSPTDNNFEIWVNDRLLQSGFYKRTYLPTKNVKETVRYAMYAYYIIAHFEMERILHWRKLKKKRHKVAALCS